MAIASIVAGASSPIIIIILVGWMNIEYACLIGALPIVPGIIALIVPPRRGVLITLRISAAALILTGMVVGIRYWISTTPPSGVKVEGPSIPAGFGTSVDPEAEERVRATTRPVATTQRIPVDLPFLNAFSGPDRQLLLRHLATSAKWHVGAGFYTTRRRVEDGIWYTEQYDFYEHPQLGQFTISFSLDEPSNDPGTDPAYTVVQTAHGASTELKIAPDNSGSLKDSHLIVKSDHASIEIYEESKNAYRAGTALAISPLNAEFSAVLASKTARIRGFDPALMPVESIRRGSPEMHVLDHGIEQGYYEVTAYLNPGENGYVYLKVFEGRQNRAHVEGERKNNETIEYIGWSSDPQEQFLYQSKVEFGGTGIFSANFNARVEAWFAPTSGGHERKLIEKYFDVKRVDN